MNIIDLEQLKKIELDITVRFDEICRAEGLRYSLGGGTLLGAVRHKGFIPWDDDVDVMMPRPDYAAFVKIMLEREADGTDDFLGIRCWENDRNYSDLSAKLFAKNTILKEDNSENFDESMGVYIDIFPVDGLADTYKKAVKAFRATSLKRELLTAKCWKRFFRSKTHPWYYEPARFALFVMSRFVNRERTFEKILKKYRGIDFESAGYAAAVGGSYREKEIYPRELFTDLIELPFEGHKFLAVADYDAYLKAHYGDYMQLPPKKKQQSHHMFTAYYRNAGSGETSGSGEGKVPTA